MCEGGEPACEGGGGGELACGGGGLRVEEESQRAGGQELEWAKEKERMGKKGPRLGILGLN